MSYARRILHYSSAPTLFQSLISDRVVAGCSFELNRLGGCGAGELQLNDEFANRDSIQVGDWIAFEYSAGVRWYMGRVEHRSATVPAGVSFRLEGMSVQLGELFAGGFDATVGQGLAPHRFANSDLFPNDPDRAVESINLVSEPRQLVILLMQQYVVPKSDILLDTTLIETLTNPSSVASMKFRGEESIKEIIKDLALRAGHASWGVQPDGKFFYLQKPTATTATWRVGRDIISLEETRERNQLYNRLLLTGGYIYDAPAVPGNEARSIYRWRGNYTQPASRTAYGERRIRMNIPWIRTAADSREFAREFFRVYAEPTTHYILDVGDQAALPFPWEGQIKIEDKDGTEIITSAVETIRVQFDHAPRFQIEIGPDDPQIHWDEPPFNERWEIPSPAVGNPRSYGGEEISLTSFLITDPPGPSSSSVVPSSSYLVSSSSPVSSSPPLSSSPPASGSSSVVNSSSSPTSLTCTLTTPASTVLEPFIVTATFSAIVTDFILTDITVTNGTASNFAGSGTTYTFTITPTAEGDVTTFVAAGVATDINSNTNSASNSLVTTYDKTLIEDSFTGTNNAFIDGRTPDITNIPGNNWIVEEGSPDIQNNQYSAGQSVAVIEIGEANVDVSTEIVLGSSSLPAASLLLRYIDSSNHWKVQIYTGRDQVEIIENINGTGTIRASASLGSVNPGDAYTLRVTVDNNDLFTIYVDGAQKLTYTKSTHHAITKHGVHTYNSATLSTHDNFKVKKL